MTRKARKFIKSKSSMKYLFGGWHICTNACLVELDSGFFLLKYNKKSVILSSAYQNVICISHLAIPYILLNSITVFLILPFHEIPCCQLKQSPTYSHTYFTMRTNESFNHSCHAKSWLSNQMRPILVNHKIHSSPFILYTQLIFVFLFPSTIEKYILFFPVSTWFHCILF